MKFTYNWLKDFVDIKIAPEALAEKLTMAGLEVSGVEGKGGDFVFEAEITSNRPDWLSVIGIAREVAAITGVKLKSAKSSKCRCAKAVGKFAIKVEDKSDCPLYSAKIIREVKVGPSPKWLKERLELIGCRSINNVVDITNYCLFTWGEPLHAFDLDKLSGAEIIVRRAKNSEKLVTIDQVERKLDADILIIADPVKPVAVAGVMGGKDTEVTEHTKNILLEAAVFNGSVVRRGRQKLGLSTDSSYRFERGVDFETAEFSACQASGLIEELSSGKCVLAKSSGKALPKTKSISLDLGLVEKILNVKIAEQKLKNILGHLGFRVRSVGKNKMMVTVPLFREDVELPEDLIEEISRIYGFENIPQTLPSIKPQVSIRGSRDLVALTKKVLTGLGLSEAITYSLVDQDLSKGFGLQDAQPVAIMNPLSKEQEVLRTTLIPSLARCVSYNLNQKQEFVFLYEIANVFSRGENFPEEELTLGIVICGEKSFFLEQGLAKENASLLEIKGVLERLFLKLGIKEYDFNPSGSGVIEVTVGGQKAGSLINLEKSALARVDIKNKDLFCAEVSLEKVFAAADLNKKFVSPPRYPGITRDISLVLKEDLAIKSVLSRLYEKGTPLLIEVRIADYYKGKQISAGLRSLTISCIYRSDERTLTEAEVNPVHSEVVRMLTESFGAKIR
ncbi:MAG: phenylalanine--tRNA ligase subunit beta [Candidatus Omnitrophica bacterium]|nr:phenylalanine--tRNA ligase subunit beta [Candidatus Omnitrophota bacterium]